MVACNQSQQEYYLVDIHSSIGRLPLIPGSIGRVQNKGEKKSQDNRSQFSEEQLWCSSLERIQLSLNNPDKSGEEVEAAKEESKTAEDQGGESSVLPPTEDRGDDDEQGQKEARQQLPCVVAHIFPEVEAVFVGIGIPPSPFAFMAFVVGDEEQGGDDDPKHLGEHTDGAGKGSTHRGFLDKYFARSCSCNVLEILLYHYELNLLPKF